MSKNPDKLRAILALVVAVFGTTLLAHEIMLKGAVAAAEPTRIQIKTRLGRVATLSDVFEDREAEPEGIAETTGTRRQGTRRCRAQDLLDPTGEQRILVREMRIEGRTANVRTFKNLVDDDGRIALFVDQRDDRVAQSRLSSAYPRILHVTACHEHLLGAKAHKRGRFVR